MSEGLLLDLNADRGISIEDGSRVTGWKNQIASSPAQFFTSRDKGRKIAGSGRPVLKTSVPAVGGHNTISFKEQELVCADEDAFDHLTTGSGYTWFFVISFSKQRGKLKDVNSFMGNLKNGGKYEGLWAGVTDDNKIWTGARNAVTFGRWDKNNPYVLAKKLEENKYYIVASRMSAGTKDVAIELFVNDSSAVAKKPYFVNKKNNASQLAIGTERDAIQHPGVESFDGDIARVLIYERPLSDNELKQTLDSLKQSYLKEIK